ncbi:hypothetical protein BDA99DRAFT_567459, partial [Phascolomyces articulosus]
MTLTNETQIDAFDKCNLYENTEIHKYDSTIERQQQHSNVQSNITPLSTVHHSHYIDFITKCPYDILCLILDQFTGDIDTLLICTTVCSSWKEILFQCPIPWKVINTSSKFWATSRAISSQQAILDKTSKFVEKIYLHRSPSVWKRFRMDYFQYYEFTNLWFLEIRNTMEDINTLYDALACISETLLELRIISRRQYIMSVTRILSTCPHLRSLYVKIFHYIQYFPDKATRTENHNSSSLVNLYFHTAPCKLAYNELWAILEQTPHLRSLSFSPIEFFGDNYLSRMIKYCPKLEAINYSFLNSNDNPDYFQQKNMTSHQYCRWINTKNSNIGNNEEGQLKVLVLGSVQSVQPLKKQLENSYASLQSLCLSPSKLIDTTLDEYDCWRPLFSSIMPNLKHMHILLDQCPLKFREQLPNILNHCPNLEILRLVGRRFEVTRSMLISQLSFRTLEAITQLKYLSQLRIDDVLIDTASLSWLIEHCSTKVKPSDDNKNGGDHTESYTSTLRVLYIKLSSGKLSPSMLSHIPRIESLEKLTFLVPDANEITSADIVQFSKMIARLPHLTSLTLGYIDIEIDAARHLATSKSLAFLRIENVEIDKVCWLLISAIRIHRNINIF